jgi:hypothetical protein
MQITASDISHWAHWLFFMPGDALIALIGPTSFGRFLNVTSASFGSATSGWISAALWLLGIWVIFYVRGFLIDCADPTYRQQQREWRKAQASARREHRERARRVGGKRRRFFWAIRRQS